jgi:predicted N-acetyltransferase YhbS
MGSGHEQPFVLRRAEPKDRDGLINVLNLAFASPDGRPFDFARFVPYCFHDGRIGNHLIRIQDGRIVGVVGLYPFEMRVGGISFHTAGIGQVGTLQEARGLGVMRSLLELACQTMAAEGYDFTWLGGDRLRYGHFGWATGGVTLRFEIAARYLDAAPPEADVHALDWGRDFAMVRDHLAGHPDCIVMPDNELEMLLGCQGTGGWALGRSFIVYRRAGDAVYLADGEAREMQALFSHHLRWLAAQPGDRQRFTVECPPGPSPLLETCVRHYRGVSLNPSGMYRVGRLVSFLQKACRVAQARVSSGSGTLALANSDTGEEATIRCRDGRLSVAEGVAGEVHRFNRTDLSEVCFGLCALDALVPGLPADSPIRRVLPLPVHWSRFFAI